MLRAPRVDAAHVVRLERDLLDARRREAQRGQPLRQLRVPTRRIDHQICRQLLLAAARGARWSHTRHAPGARVVEQTADFGMSPDAQIR